MLNPAVTVLLSENHLQTLHVILNSVVTAPLGGPSLKSACGLCFECCGDCAPLPISECSSGRRRTLHVALESVSNSAVTVLLSEGHIRTLHVARDSVLNSARTVLLWPSRNSDVALDSVALDSQ